MILKDFSFDSVRELSMEFLERTHFSRGYYQDDSLIFENGPAKYRL